MAARGITGSGVEAGAMTQMQTDKSQAEAMAIAQAPQAVAEQQANFMSTQQPRMDNAFNSAQNANINTVNTMGNLSNAYGNQATSQYNLAGQYGTSAASALGGAGYLLGNKTTSIPTVNTAPPQVQTPNTGTPVPIDTGDGWLS